MEINRAIEILREFNKWRRDDEGEMPQPKQIGEAIDTVVDDYEQRTNLQRPWQYQNSTL